MRRFIILTVTAVVLISAADAERRVAPVRLTSRLQ